MKPRSADLAFKTAFAGFVFLRGRVKFVAMIAGKIDGQFCHFHCGSMGGRQADFYSHLGWNNP
jgi:hypothetical protein